MPATCERCPTRYVDSALKIRYPVFPVKANIEYRQKLLQQAAADPALGSELFKICKNDIIYWINLTAWTKDTRIEPPINPFICYDFQIPFTLKVQRYVKEGLGDLGVEKTRDMGVSWMVLYVFQHFFQFSEGSDFRVGSRKEEFVDKIGVIDTLLEKVRFNLERQPLFLMPKGFETVREFRDNTTYMKLVNKVNSNSIIGESANAHFGSGGRSRAVLLDEFAKWDTGIDENAWTSTADVTRCRIPVSTPVGSANKFARLMRGTREKIEKETLHWTLHPEKARGSYYLSDGIKIPINLSEDYTAAYKLWIKLGRPSKTVRSPWYDQEAERRTDEDLAQEVDIDYHRSGSMFFNAQALSSQKVWELHTRSTPDSAIPYGKYIRGKIIEVNDKVRFIESRDGWLKIFELPKADHQYTLGADTAEGLLKGDQSAGVIVEKTTGNVVAAWNYLVPPEDFAKDIQQAAWYYNEADVAAENNNHGYTTNKELSEMSHVKLYHTKRDETAQGEQNTPKRGWSTTSKSRPEMLNHLAHLIDKVSCELRDPDLIGQCETFIRNGEKGGRPEADGSFLDDLIVAASIAEKVTEEIPYVTRQKVTGAQREAIEKRLHTKNAGFGFRR